MKALTINLPFIYAADDNYDVYHLLEILKRVGNENLAMIEDFQDGLYLGIYYLGKRPSEIQIERLKESL